MSFDAWITLGLVVVMFAGLASGRVGADLIVLGIMAGLLVFGVITPAEAVAGFSSQGLITVGLLYVVTAGLKETGAITWLTGVLLGRPKTALQAQSRLILPVAFSSAFVNNTPIVAMFLPVLTGLSRRTGIPVGYLFMPLSFAAILGGICTLIGTSTNLVVSGLISEFNKHVAAVDALPEYSMFTLTRIGVPIAIVGVIYILLFGRRLLPGRAPQRISPDAARQYMTAMLVKPDSPVVGKTVEQAGLRHLPGLFLSRIERESETVLAVSPDEKVQAGDVLIFVGVLDSVVDLQKIRGLVPFTDDVAYSAYRPNMQLIEAVVSARSPLIGSTIREAGIRTRYSAVVVAVHRQGHRLAGKLGDIKLRPGDTLLLEAAPGFATAHRHSTDFYLVSEVEEAAAPRHERAMLAVGILAGLVVLISTGLVAPVVGALVAACLMVLTRCCTGPQARASIDWQVLVVIGGAFSMGRAMESSGLAEAIAHGLVGLAQPMGTWAVVGVLYAVTVCFTAMINNNAAAVLVFPIAVEAARNAGISPMPIIVAITVAATAEFTTPLGYQTNLMVMGPGGYKWLDYVKFGGPLTLIAGGLCVALAPLLY